MLYHGVIWLVELHGISRDFTPCFISAPDTMYNIQAMKKNVQEINEQLIAWWFTTLTKPPFMTFMLFT